MNPPLLGTKFHVPPKRSDRLARHRLVGQLDNGTRGPLTLLSAPPGFGKTTLLAEWLGSRNAVGDVAWLSLDALDDHAGRFWTYLVTALASVRPAVGRCGVLELLDAPQPPPIGTLLSVVLNELGSSPADLVLILDDYHVIESPEIHRGMEFLLDHLPSQLHLLVASRVDPPFPLARLRTRGQLAEVRATDLRFTLDEADEYFNIQLHLGLRREDVARLERRTEGWAGALHLAALSLRGRADAASFIDAFSGDNRFVVDYLVEEVLDRQPAEVRAFLLRTSIVERLSAPLCDFVTGAKDGRAMLETLERSNLFLSPLDDGRQWYRYHQLFSDVLQAYLAEEYPDDIPALHLRASAWYAENGEPERAVDHALAAGDVVRAAGLIELQADAIMRRHHPHQLIDWLKPIPDSVIRSMPVLSTYLGHAFQGAGDMERSAARLADAERLMAERPGDAVVSDQASFAILPALIAVGQGYLAMAARDPDATVDRATLALTLLAEDQHRWRGTALALTGLAHWVRGDLEPAQWFHSQAGASFERAADTSLAITSAYHDAELLKARGRLNEAERRLRASLRFAADCGLVMRGAANLHLGLAELCCEHDDFDGADRELSRAIEAGVYPPRTPFRLCLAKARLAQSRGELEEAADLITEAERLSVRGAVPDYRPPAAWRARIRAQQGRIAEAMDWVGERSLTADDELSYGREYEHITLARVLLARGSDADLAAARRLLERLLEAAQSAGRLGTALEISLLLAIACWAGGDEAAALAALGPALIRAEPEGYARLFLDEGPPIGPLLRAAAGSGLVPAYCRKLLGGLGEAPAALRPLVSGPESLSEREGEVLRMLASELSGPEIANTLVVSLHTMRSHTKNIYTKLGVNSRRAAVRRAVELGLL